METVGWEHLPLDGGLLNQPEWLWNDLQIIAWRKQCVEKMMIDPVKEAHT
jgi:hypothetical protein